VLQYVSASKLSSKPQSQRPPALALADLMASTGSGSDPVPANLQRATLRLDFPPSYVVVGVYRLCTDRLLYRPAWDKCKHGAQRGLIVGFVWVRSGTRLQGVLLWLTSPKTCLTYRIQKHIIRTLLNNPSSVFSLSYIARLSHTASDLSEETFLGVKLPFNVSTCSCLGSACLPATS